MTNPAPSSIDTAATVCSDGGTASSVSVAEVDIVIPAPGRNDVAARIYKEDRLVDLPSPAAASMPAVLHFHGGTFACGSLDDGRIVARLLARAGAVVVSIAYPLATDQPFPAAVDIGYEALQWLYRKRLRLAGRGAPIFVAGEEAGGNLAAALALIARDRGAPPLAGQILLSPMLDPCSGTPSLREAHAGICGCPWADGWQAYLRSPNDTTHPYAVPGASLRLAQLPPTLIIVGHVDAMRDEGLKFAARLKGAGVDVETLELMNHADNTGPPATVAPEVAERACAVTVLERMRTFLVTHLPPPT